MIMFPLSIFNSVFNYVISRVLGGMFNNSLSAEYCILKIREDPGDVSSSVMDSFFPH